MSVFGDLFKSGFASSLGSGLAGGLASSLVSLPFSALGTVIENASARKTAQFNYDLAEKTAQAQYERQLDFWNKQNAYNDPSKVLQRWSNAGINPLAVVSGGNAGSAGQGQALSQVPGNEYGKHGVLPLSPVSPMQIFSNFVATRKMSAEAGLTDNQSAHEILKMDLTRLYKAGQITKNEYDQYMLILEKEYGRREREAGIHETESRASYNDAITTTENALRDLRSENLDAQNSLLIAQKGLTAAQKALTEAQTDTEKERARNLAQDTVLKSCQTALVQMQTYAQQLSNDLQKEVHDFQLTEDKLTIAGITIWNKGTRLSQSLESQLQQLQDNGKITYAQARSAAQLVDLQVKRAEVQNAMYEAQTDKIKHDDSWWNRTINGVNDTLRSVGTLIHGGSSAPTSSSSTSGNWTINTTM